MAKKVEETAISTEWSFELFNLIRYIRGRKKSLLASLGASAGAYGLGLGKEALIILLAGLVFEGILAMVEYGIKKVPKH